MSLASHHAPTRIGGDSLLLVHYNGVAQMLVLLCPAGRPKRLPQHPLDISGRHAELDRPDAYLWRDDQGPVRLCRFEQSISEVAASAAVTPLPAPVGSGNSKFLGSIFPFTVNWL